MVVKYQSSLYESRVEKLVVAKHVRGNMLVLIMRKRYEESPSEVTKAVHCNVDTESTT